MLIILTLINRWFKLFNECKIQGSSSIGNPTSLLTVVLFSPRFHS